MNVSISKISFLLISISLTSCSLFNSITTLSGNDATIVNSSNNNNDKNSTKKKSSKKKKSNKHNAKSKTSSTIQNTTIEEYDISTTSQPIELINGEWTVFSVDGETISGEECPYIIFSEKGNKIYGSNGCNIINGDYEATESGEIAFINIISTMMACDNSPYENAINNAVNNAAMYSITQNGNEYYMTINSFENQELLVLRKHNMDFLNGSWRVSEIKDKKNKNEGITLMLDIPEFRLHGNTGCNIVNGSIYIDSDKNNSIQFHGLIATRMACPENDMKTETALLVALEEVEYAQKAKGNTVKLFDKDNNEILVLTKINNK